MKVTINNKEYNFEYRGWWGPLYKYEELMDVENHPERKFNPTSTFKLHVMYYAILMADNEVLDITIEEFLRALEDLTLCNALGEQYAKRIAVLSQGMPSANSENKKKAEARFSRRKKPIKE